MNYLFVSESLGQQPALIGEIDAMMGGDGRMETYRNVDDFSARLHRHNRPRIMILVVNHRRDLEAISENREVVVEADVILLVPDGEEETIALAHTLRPNFLGRTDCDQDKVVAVLERLLEKSARQAGQQRQWL